MESNFKVGDIIVFQQDIFTHIGHYLLVPAKAPCKIKELSKSHVVVQLLKRVSNCAGHDGPYVLRRIDTRMTKITGLGKILYE